MKRLLTSLLCLLTVCALTQVPMQKRAAFFKHRVAAGGGPTYIVQENWEGANAITSGTGNADLTGWTATAASVNGDLSTSGLSLEAAECFGGGDGEYAYHTFTGQSEVWLYLLYRKHTTAPISNHPLLSVGDGAGENVLISVRDGDTLTDTLCVSYGGSASHTVSVLANDTTYGVWVHIVVNGASSSISAAFAESPFTEPTTGDNFVSRVGTLNNNRTTLMLYGGASGDRMDKIRVATTAIGNAP